MTASAANQVLSYGSLITTTGTLIGHCRLRQRLGAYVTSFSACRPFPQPTAITGKDDNLQKNLNFLQVLAHSPLNIALLIFSFSFFG